MKTQTLPQKYEHLSPAGAEVRVLMSNAMAGVAHCTLKNGKISRAVCHKTVGEIWTVISGYGEIWCKQDSTTLITPLEAGMTIDITVGTHFQYRSLKNDLVFICVTTPPWPGADEVFYVSDGVWRPSENMSQLNLDKSR